MEEDKVEEAGDKAEDEAEDEVIEAEDKVEGSAVIKLDAIVEEGEKEVLVKVVAKSRVEQKRIAGHGNQLKVMIMYLYLLVLLVICQVLKVMQKGYENQSNVSIFFLKITMMNLFIRATLCCQ